MLQDVIGPPVSGFPLKSLRTYQHVSRQKFRAKSQCHIDRVSIKAMARESAQQCLNRRRHRRHRCQRARMRSPCSSLMMLEPGMFSKRLVSISMRSSASCWTVVSSANVAMQGTGHDVQGSRDLGITCATHRDAPQLTSFLKHTLTAMSTSLSTVVSLDPKVILLVDAILRMSHFLVSGFFAGPRYSRIV